MRKNSSIIASQEEVNIFYSTILNCFEAFSTLITFQEENILGKPMDNTEYNTEGRMSGDVFHV